MTLADVGLWTNSSHGPHPESEQTVAQGSAADWRELEADCWPDSLRLSDIEDRFVCQKCGKRGVDVRPDFAEAKRGT